MSLVSKLI